MDKNSPFQTYDDRSDAATVGPRLAALRAELATRGLDGFVVPHADEHQNEYLPANAERLAWLTSFTGSAGAAVVLMDKAAVFVDGRYTLQVRAQTDTALFEPRDLVAEGPQGWIPDHLPLGGKLGFDPWLITANGAAGLRQAAERAGGSLVPCDCNPLDKVWSDQPPPPMGPAVPHTMNLAGEDSQSKRTRVAASLKKAHVDAAVLTLCDSVCWLFNIRGSDLPHTPFVLALAILHEDGSADLFLD
jgi:Xaa-Pro aminopeptidase